MTTPAIRAEEVSVRFRQFLDRKPTLRKSLARLRHRDVGYVEALTEVSFQVEAGQAFGIIGPNGAGKSTLLRCVAGTLRPNSGRVVVNGKISTLLQLGVGFNGELSGRRNIYLGGLSAGLRRAEIDGLYDDIVAYAELEDAIHRPVKTYSSGMFARLAFSIGMHLEPDILLLDEVFAVGDQSFREKSTATMQSVLDRSGTIVYVSHSLDSVVRFCDQAMWLDRGRVRLIGDSQTVVDSYRGANAPK